MKFVLKTVFFLILVTGLYSQTSLPDTQSILQQAPRVYIDCNFCDLDFIREEIPFVNYVRDRKEAQVHVLITRQTTGTGGKEFTLTFIGYESFLGKNDTLRYISGQSDTDDDIRKGITGTLKIGLIRYVAYTPMADQISVSYRSGAKTTEVVDEWDYWVFGISAHTFGSGEKSSNSFNLYGRIYANRITPEWKMRFSVNSSYYENNFEVGGVTISSFSRSRGFNASVVKSLDDHWSAALMAGYISSTYLNIRNRFRLTPAIEYNIFPYSESTHHELRIEYGVRNNAVEYFDKTIYYKTSEYLLRHYMTITLKFNQPWGSTETSLDASQYLHDLTKNRFQLFSRLQLRLFTGFSLQLFGNFSMIHDQLRLPLSGATQEEVLLRRKELATTYSYFVSFGFNYQFGSIYTNVVNTRFGGSSGGYSVSISY